jgi:uncharacterized protein
MTGNPPTPRPRFAGRHEMTELFGLTGAAAANLLTPAVLFFVIGMSAGLARSDLSLPDQAAKTLSLYLMLCIGFKGGVEARASGLDPAFLAVGGLGLALSFLAPFLAYAVLRASSRLDRATAAATAAHYGSVSVVTFAAGSQYLQSIGVAFDGYMAAVLALMETPAILAALLIAGRGSAPKQTSHARGDLIREVFLNGATIMLVGSFVVGAVTGQAGMAKLDLFVGPLFQGALCLFLLDMGLVAARQLLAAPRLQASLIAFALLTPLVSAAVALGAARAMNMELGNAVLFVVLAASASYIAVPAAMRIALPKADAGVYLTLSLGVTFPFNLLIGIPLYYGLAAWIWE